MNTKQPQTARLIMHWWVVLREERYLAQQLGEIYLVYKSTTRRWL